MMPHRVHPAIARIRAKLAALKARHAEPCPPGWVRPSYACLGRLNPTAWDVAARLERTALGGLRCPTCIGRGTFHYTDRNQSEKCRRCHGTGTIP